MADVLDQIEAPVLRRLYRYWEGKRGTREFPARRDLDPVEFSYALGIILLIDVLREPLRFRFRLHGTTLALRAGYEMTGKMVDDLPGEENRALLLERCHQIVATRKPLSIHGDRRIDGHRRRYETLWLPLGPDDGAVDMLFGALYYLDPWPAPGT